MNIFNSQNKIKHKAGIACGNNVELSIAAKEGFQALNKLYNDAPPIQV